MSSFARPRCCRRAFAPPPGWSDSIWTLAAGYRQHPWNGSGKNRLNHTDDSVQMSRSAGARHAEVTSYRGVPLGGLSSVFCPEAAPLEGPMNALKRTWPVALSLALGLPLLANDKDA